MKKFLSIFVLLYCFLNLQAQENEVQKQINEDVWKPFMTSYAALDADAFMAVHTDDIIRISRDWKNIKQGAEYAKSMQENSANNKAQNRKRKIEFSFLERFATGDVAFEVGIYKVTIDRPDEDSSYYYGKFHVVLKKIEGKWKIMIDSDTSVGGTLTEDDFLKGEKLE